MMNEYETAIRALRLYQVQKRWPDEYADPEFPEFEPKTKAMYLCKTCAQEDETAIDIGAGLEGISCQRCHHYLPEE
jgi:DNA-directed RNA polymerase subunit RPC12/RpoP